MERKLIKDQALVQAMLVFWRHGYNGTSMEMLTAELGVGKPSLYAAFGNKRSLFMAALTHYRTVLVERVRQALAEAATPRAGIDRVVRLTMLSLYDPNPVVGCFASNAALELADQDAEVTEHIRTMLRELGQLLEQALRQAQEQGEVTHRVPPQVLAGFLVNAIEGARITEKTQPVQEEQEAVVEFVLRALDG